MRRRAAVGGAAEGRAARGARAGRAGGMAWGHWHDIQEESPKGMPACARTGGGGAVLFFVPKCFGSLLLRPWGNTLVEDQDFCR